MNRIKIAPMVAVSTAHARKLMRIIHPDPVLYTEMLIDHVSLFFIFIFLIAINAPYHKLVNFLGHEKDSNTVVQIASNSASNFLLACTRLYNEFGYTSFNLNCGCPSTKIAGEGSLGAALMLHPK